MKYLIVFSITLAATVFFTYIMKAVATKLNIVDIPDKDRKVHKKKTPLMGGVAIFLAFFTILFLFREDLLSGDLNIGHWLGFFFGSAVLIIGGVIDDKYELAPKQQFIFPLVATICLLIGGIDMVKITNPFSGGYIHLDVWQIPLIHINSLTMYFTVLSDLLIFVWLMGMMYTTKLLDGIDGLVGGVVMIGALIIFLFTVSEKFYQGDLAIASLVLLATCLGFLVFNFHPASIFLGEGGSLFLGYALGTLAIISGGKIAIALLVMGIPILDVFWTIIRRLRDKKNPFSFSDKLHLHFRILNLGIGQRNTVFLYYLIALSFGLCALFLQSMGKIMALGVLILLMFVLVAIFSRTHST